MYKYLDIHLLDDVSIIPVIYLSPYTPIRRVRSIMLRCMMIHVDGFVGAAGLCRWCRGLSRLVFVTSWRSWGIQTSYNRSYLVRSVFLADRQCSSVGDKTTLRALLAKHESAKTSIGIRMMDAVSMARCLSNERFQAQPLPRVSAIRTTHEAAAGIRLRRCPRLLPRWSGYYRTSVRQ